LSGTEGLRAIPYDIEPASDFTLLKKKARDRVVARIRDKNEGLVDIGRSQHRVLREKALRLLEHGMVDRLPVELEASHRVSETSAYRALYETCCG
jgi:hypothetical protein